MRALVQKVSGGHFLARGRIHCFQSCGVAFPQKGESALLAKGPIPSDRSFYTGESLCDGVENYNENLFKIY